MPHQDERATLPTKLGLPASSLSKLMGRSGTGLGMAVVWGTIQDHRGLIQVASIEGQGTTIQIFFPETVASVHAALTGKTAAIPVEFLVNECIV